MGPDTAATPEKDGSCQDGMGGPHKEEAAAMAERCWGNCTLEIASTSASLEEALGKVDLPLDRRRPGGRNGGSVPPCLQTAEALSYLAVFGIVGVLLRVVLEEACGEHGLHVVADWHALFKDLPVNMTGCFFLGVFSVLDCSKDPSSLITVALSTGLLGSLTTYSRYNQAMVELTVAGDWPSALVGLLIGLELPVLSLVMGIASGKGLLALYGKHRDSKRSPQCANAPTRSRTWPSGWRFGIGVTTWLFILLPGFIALALLDTEYRSRQIVWLACATCPLGVWLRWQLTRLNHPEDSSAPWLYRYIPWIPWGTLLTNFIACLLAAAFATVSVGVEGHLVEVVVRAVQMGPLGCLSTFSAFAMEIYTLKQQQQGVKEGRAYAYAVLSVVLTQALALIVYGVPVWMQRWEKAFPSRPPVLHMRL